MSRVVAVIVVDGDVLSGVDVHLLLSDALGEFVVARGAGPLGPEMSVDRDGVVEHALRRYRGQSESFIARKIEEVVARAEVTLRLRVCDPKDWSGGWNHSL